MKKYFVILISVFILVSCLNTKTQSHEKVSVSLLQMLDSLGLQKEDLNIQIDKSDYTLSILSNTEVVKKYSVVFGTNPVDDKLMEGDRCTPEGRFKVRDHYQHQSWSKFIWIDYPTQDSWTKHNQAKANNTIPSNASIGGEIGIHGVPDGKSYLIEDKINWTLGCIALTNEDINEIYKVVYKGMNIEIVK